MSTKRPSGASDLEGGETDGKIECPKCRAMMTRVDVGGVVVDRCQACGGLWLDALEKEKLLAVKGAAKKADAGGGAARARQPERKADRQAKVLCPRDKSTLIRMVDARQPKVGYESCTVCGGVFLDAGELTDLSELTLREWVRTFIR